MDDQGSALDASAKLPEKLSVNVILANGVGEPREFAAQSAGNGIFKVKVTPVPRDPDRQVGLDVRSPNGQVIPVQVRDSDVKVGDARFMLSDLRLLIGGSTPRAQRRGDRWWSARSLGWGRSRQKWARRPSRST